jgi:hypothetical protein
MDLFDVALASKIEAIEWNKAYRTQSGSLLPLATVFFKNSSGGRMTTTTPEGDRIIVVTTPFGNVVLHETDRASTSVIAMAPKDLMGILGKGKLTDDQISMVLGLWGKDNIGEVLSKLIHGARAEVA